MLKGVQEHPAFAERYALVSEALGTAPLAELERGNVAWLNQNRVSSLLTLLASSLSLDVFRAGEPDAPAFTAGYSVGQWTALYAAGVLPFPRLVEVVARRAAAMDRCFAQTPGAMLAVIGLRAEQVEEALAPLRAAGHRVWISNLNCVGQYTLAGTATGVAAAQEALAALKPKKLQPLPVSGAWHSPLLDPAEEDFGAYLAEVELAAPLAPVIDNVTGDPLPRERPALDRQLARHLNHPVQWERGLRTMLAGGVTRFVEIGWGNVLTKFGFFVDRSVEHRAFYVR